MFLEVENFFIEHAVLLLLPAVWIAQRRFHLFSVSVRSAVCKCVCVHVRSRAYSFITSHDGEVYVHAAVILT